MGNQEQQEGNTMFSLYYYWLLIISINSLEVLFFILFHEILM